MLQRFPCPRCSSYKTTCFDFKAIDRYRYKLKWFCKDCYKIFEDIVDKTVKLKKIKLKKKR